MRVDATRQNRFAWMVVGMLFAGSVVNYMDRAALGVVIPRVRADLSLSNADYGMALNAFLVAYMVLYILGGRVADRLGARRTFCLTVTFWSFAAMLHASVRGLASLCLARGLLGVGEGGFYPTAIRGAAEWFLPANRAKAVGIFLCGLSVGMVITPPIVAWITLRAGWRVAFLFTGAVGLLLLPPWLLLHKRIRETWGRPDPAPALGSTDEAAQAATDSTVRQVLSGRKYWFVLLARAASDAVWLFYLFWIPAYFQDVRGFDLAMVGRLLWIPPFCADLGALAGAWASSYLIARGLGLDRSRKGVMLISAAMNVVGTAAYLAASPFTALALVSLAFFGHLSWASNVHTVITEISPPRHVAVLYGVTGAAGTAAGAIVQPIIGRVVDAVGYGPVFGGCAFAYLLAAVMILAAGKIEPFPLPEPSTA